MSISVKRRTLSELLVEAQARISRLSPAEAHAAMGDGAVLIDIRSDSNRSQHGIVPGSLHIPRTVLEWRTAPESEFRNPYLGDVEQEIILICDHGCSSVLAAAVLADLGFTRAGDVIGGFDAWRESNLPISRAPSSRPPGVLSGMGRPDS